MKEEETKIASMNILFLGLTGARYYDSEFATFLSVDPLASNFTSESPYLYTGSNPMYYTDPTGKYKYPANADYSKYSELTKFLKSDQFQALLKDTDVRLGLEYFGGFTSDQINNLISNFGEGIEIEIKDLQGWEVNGYTPGDYIQIDTELANQLQLASSPDEKKAALFAITKTILHETIHYGITNFTFKEQKYLGPFSHYKFLENGEIKSQYLYLGTEIGTSDEEGAAFENGVFGNGGLSSKIETTVKQFRNGGLTDQLQILDNNRMNGYFQSDLKN